MRSRLIIPYPHPSVARQIAKGDADNAVERLVKYVPTEIISGYVFLSGIVNGAARTSPLRLPASWALFFCGTVGTWFYLRHYKPVGIQKLQLPISTISFVLWAYALGGPFTMGSPLLGKYPYEGWFASFLAGLYSIAVAMFWKPVAPPPPPQAAPDPRIVANEAISGPQQEPKIGNLP